MIYKGYEIAKFYSEKFVPRHVISEYYQTEKDSIDRMIRLEEKKKENIKNGNTTNSVNESIDEFLNWCNEE